MEVSETPAPDEVPPRKDARPARAGELIREARERAGIPAAKVCADLRISTATLEALEAGDYAKLPGSPYIRAMLVSLSRYLRLDPREVLGAYAEETGSRHAHGVSVSPYKDDSKSHARAHKQFFILLLAVLLLILLLIMGKVNTPTEESGEPLPPATDEPGLVPDAQPDNTRVDTLGIDTIPQGALPVEDDTGVFSDAPSAIGAFSDSVRIRVLPDEATEPSRFDRPGQPAEDMRVEAVALLTRPARGGIPARAPNADPRRGGHSGGGGQPGR